MVHVDKVNLILDLFSDLVWNNILNKWDEWLLQNKISPLQASLHFVGRWGGIKKNIVGIGGMADLEEIIQAFIKRIPSKPALISGTSIPSGRDIP